MSKIPTGKGMFIWILSDCEKGNPLEIVRAAKAAGLGHVLIKVANGTYPYNGDIGPVVSALKAAGVQVWGWTYVYGHSVEKEAAQAVNRTIQYKLDGLVVNAEAEWKTMIGAGQKATALLTSIRNGLGSTVPVGLSSYRYPSIHPEFPWREFLGAVDFNMPQVYWMDATNAGAQLRRSVAEFGAMQIKRPIVPTGAAFKEHGWSARPAEVLEFLTAAYDMEFPGANFWEWGRTRRDLPACWDVIAQFPWALAEPVEPVAPTVQAGQLEVLQSLNLRTAPGGAAIRTMQAGERLRLIEIGRIVPLGGERYTWIKVETARGEAGWCVAAFATAPAVKVIG